MVCSYMNDIALKYPFNIKHCSHLNSCFLFEYFTFITMKAKLSMITPVFSAHFRIHANVLLKKHLL